MPPPSTELTLHGVHVRAYLATLSPKKRRAYLAEVMRVHEEYEMTVNLYRLRPREHDEATAKARRGALAWSRAMLARFFVFEPGR